MSGSKQAVAGKQVFTTGQVAKLLNVPGRSVTRWCDSGRLLSQDRRVRREELCRFCAFHGLCDDWMTDLERAQAEEWCAGVLEQAREERWAREREASQ